MAIVSKSISVASRRVCREPDIGNGRVINTCLRYTPTTYAVRARLRNLTWLGRIDLQITVTSIVTVGLHGARSVARHLCDTHSKLDR